MPYRTPLSRVRGLGSAKEGTRHFWAQRLTAVALVPLLLWLMAAFIGHVGAPYEVVAAWVRQPLVGVLLVCLILALVHHAQLGLQVVLEDYLGAEGTRIAAILALKMASVLVGAAAVLAVLRVALSG